MNETEPGSKQWRFSIDVGGTFTDCVAMSPAGNRLWTKVLSSGVTKGRPVEFDGDTFIDPNRIPDGTDFWNGYGVSFFDRHSCLVGSAYVVGFNSSQGQFLLDWSTKPVNGDCVNRYELCSGESAPLIAIRKLTRLGLQQPLPPMAVRLGTTQGTNALLTRTGSPTALVISRGFGDLLEIGQQNRPHLFQLCIKKNAPLYREVIEVDERIYADGSVVVKPNCEQISRQLQIARSSGIQSVAICLMHGYLFPKHEQIIAEIANKIGFDDVSLSSEVAPLIKIVPRGETTVLDSYLNPVLQTHLRGFSKYLSEDSRLELMTSAGNLVPPLCFRGSNSILSGPAGGVVGFSQIARQYGFDQSIGFDMGGTSTDVARFGKYAEKNYESIKAGVRVIAPMLAIETVASGGGSLCWFDGTRLRVGPGSAGADPGPACYGKGGPLCVTDLNVYLGKMVTDQFPFPLDTSAIERKLDELRQQLNQTSRHDYSLPKLAEGLLRIANSNMSAAVKSVSVSKGYDPRQHVLVAFGGAAAQHACAVAQALGIDKVLIHTLGSILSAVGISISCRAVEKTQSFTGLLKTTQWPDVQTALEQLTKQATDELRDNGVESNAFQVRTLLDLSYQQTHAQITIAAKGCQEFRERFEQRHQAEFGFLMDREIQIVAVRVEVTEFGPAPDPSKIPPTTEPAPPTRYQRSFVQNKWRQIPLYDRGQLRPGNRLIGPAVIEDELSSTNLEPDWFCDVVDENAMVLGRKASTPHQVKPIDITETADPVLLEIFNSHFTSIAQQMGERIRKTAVSVNVKERLDFSCAIFTAKGDLVVNAPHVPVHLGAMGETVKSIIEQNDSISPGDVFVSNDPFRGGSHLPDITVVTPVFDSNESQIVFFVANRCHHAEIGGLTAGSMPPHAQCLADEGVLITNFKLIRRGRGDFDAMHRLLSSGPYPSRSPDQNIQDLTAQVTANQQGVNELFKLINQYGLPRVLQYMQFIQEAAEQKTRQALINIKDLDTTFEDQMDGGAKIVAHVVKSADRLSIDFSGTDPVQANNLNANRAITTSAILYCLRCLIDEDIPLNQGILNPVEIRLPECFINPPFGVDPQTLPAVSAGNVETSQRIVDVLLGALGLAAASQGTMNNFLMGNETFGYYETLCGGTGATAHGPGAHAVHSHMTNTRLTDPEILESQFPVILRRFAIRPFSGGDGAFVGGNGVVREFEFCASLTVTLITNRRSCQPYGIHGGGPGAPGHNLWTPKGRQPIKLASQCTLEISRGDALCIETPGGGGWGTRPDP